MTQFLIVQTDSPGTSLLDFSFEGVDRTASIDWQAPFLGKSGALWKVETAGAELDESVVEARNDLLRGTPVEQTRLGALLAELVDAKVPFALFWASDNADLPRARDKQALFDLLTEQLGPSFTGEIYVSSGVDV